MTKLLLLIFFLTLFEPLKTFLPRPKTTYGLAKIFILFLFLKQFFLILKNPKLFNQKIQKLFFPLLLFLTLNIISAVFSYNVSTAFSQVSFLFFAGLLFFLSFYQDWSKENLEKFCFLFLIFTFLVGLISVLSFSFLGATKNLWYLFFPQETLTRYLGDLDRHRLLPLWDLEMATPLVLFFLLFSKGKKRFLAFLTLILQALTIFFSNTRYRLLTFLAGFLFLFLIKKKGKYLLFLPLLLLVPFAIVLAKSQLQITLLDRFLFKNPGLDLYSLQIRVIYLQETLQIVQKFPLFGVGPGNFPYFTTTDLRYIPQGYNYLSFIGDLQVVSPHNIFLQILAETGLLGFLSFLYLIFSFLKNDILLHQKKLLSPLILSLVFSSWLYLFNNLTSIVNTSASGLAYFLFLRGILSHLLFEAKPRTKKGQNFSPPAGLAAKRAGGSKSKKILGFVIL